MPPTPLRGPAFEAFIAPARAYPALWRCLVGLLIAAVVWFGAVVVAFRIAAVAGIDAADPILPVVYLASFAGLALGIVLAARLTQRRGAASLIGPRPFSPRAFGKGVVFVLAIAAIGVVEGMVSGDPLRLQRAPGDWLGVLPIALVALLAQTSAEELAFRGYLTQSLAARFDAPAIWLGVPAILFGALHWDPATYGPNAWLVVANAGLVGLILADVTARTGGLSLAMGLHFANNAVALLLVASPGPLSGLALFVSSIGPDEPAAFRRLILAGIVATSAGYGLWLWWHHRGLRVV